MRGNLNKFLEFSKKLIINHEQENDLKSLSWLVKNSKNLIEYLKKLESDKIRLEDLVDVIDDTSQETDALIQEMMEVRNAFICLMTGDPFEPTPHDESLPMIQCLVSRYTNYMKYVRSKDRLQSTINKCIDNLDTISLKISSQADRAAKTLQTMTSFI